MTQVLQCPRCEVRVPTISELNDHLSHDHPDFRAQADTMEDDLLGACHCHHRHLQPEPRGDATRVQAPTRTTARSSLTG